MKLEIVRKPWWKRPGFVGWSSGLVISTAINPHFIMHSLAWVLLPFVGIVLLDWWMEDLRVKQLTRLYKAVEEVEEWWRKLNAKS